MYKESICRFNNFNPPAPKKTSNMRIGYVSTFFVFEGHHLEMGPSLQCYTGMANLHIVAGGEASRYEG
jgi:hypothetical protein